MVNFLAKMKINILNVKLLLLLFGQLLEKFGYFLVHHLVTLQLNPISDRRIQTHDVFCVQTSWPVPRERVKNKINLCFEMIECEPVRAFVSF